MRTRQNGVMKMMRMTQPLLAHNVSSGRFAFHCHSVFWLNKNTEINFNEEFDIFLAEIRPLSKDNQDRTTIGSRLIPFETLQKRASEDEFTLRTLPLSKLRSR